MKQVTKIEDNQKLALFSYSTPVAYLDKTTGNVYKTSKKWSATTTKHINAFMREIIESGLMVAFNPVSVEQEELDKLFPFSVTR